MLKFSNFLIFKFYKLLDYDSINSSDEEYKKLLSLEKWFDLFKEKDKKKLDEEFLFLEESLRELQQDFGMYTEVRMPKEKEYDPDSSEYAEDYYPVDEKIDYNLYLFGINISEMSKNYKTGIGLGLLSLVMSVLYYVFYYVRKNGNRRNKKKRY